LAYKEIGTKNHWINNNLKIWNNLTKLLKLKTEIGYTPTNINIKIKDDQIKLKTFFQLQFMKEIVKLYQTFINMVDRVIIDIPAIEKHLERVIQMFLQFDKEYLIIGSNANIWYLM
jgi:hypothetical protein